MLVEKLDNLRDLLEVKLQGLYDAEQQLVRPLPEMAARATNPQLRQGLEKHLRETETHVTRLEQVACGLDVNLDGAGCQAMRGLVDEAADLMGRRAAADVCDAAIISAAQGVEHYEIAQYGTVIQFARHLGYQQAGKLLAQTLREEKQANEARNRVALGPVNEKALSDAD